MQIGFCRQISVVWDSHDVLVKQRLDIKSCYLQLYDNTFLLVIGWSGFGSYDEAPVSGHCHFEYDLQAISARVHTAPIHPGSGSKTSFRSQCPWPGWNNDAGTTHQPWGVQLRLACGGNFIKQKQKPSFNQYLQNMWASTIVETLFDGTRLWS